MKNQAFYLPVLILLCITFCCADQLKKPQELTGEAVELNWNVGKNEKLIYKTIMTPLEEGSLDMNFGGLLEQFLGEDSGEAQESAKNFFKELRSIADSTNLKAVLSQSEFFNDVIEIEVLADNQKKDKQGLGGIAQAMMQGTVLRGSVNEKGDIHSFWVKGTQKNLISLLFELPTKPVHIGESWELQALDLIENDHNFVCKEAFKQHKVTLTDIKEVDGEQIAFLSYDIQAYSGGDFNSQMFQREPKTVETSINIIYKAEAEFSLSKGRWKSYQGIYAHNMTGYMTVSQKQKFALIPIEE